MKYCTLAILAALLFSQLTARPASQPAFNAHDLSITWEPIQNNYQNKGQSLNALTITNNGKNTFPASGWELFFNDAGMLLPATPSGNAIITFLNGDLFSLAPTATFGEIKPGASVRVEFIGEDAVVNITDGPDGFYIVWDNEPAKGYNTAGVTIKPFSPNYKGLITPAIIYDQNKNIKDIPEPQLTKVFPTPVSYKETGGTFTLNKNTFVGTTFDDGALGDEYQSLKTFLQSLLNDEFVDPTPKKPVKYLKTGKHLNVAVTVYAEGFGEEGYELTVSTDGIKINASAPAGASVPSASSSPCSSSPSC